MKTKSKYAVVDLETTGNSFDSGDRIIQFGCTIIVDNKIVKNFSSNINPQMEISKRITQLTGIDNSDVVNAPTLEEEAPKILKLLKGTIFVAHNVNFDFPFLNHELNRIGLPSLNILAIDTVTLSQILLPNLKSYRLRDLTQFLGIKHQHPHEAISDASATAQLLLLLFERINALPSLTLKQILNLNIKLPGDTLNVFEKVYRKQKRHPKPLPGYLKLKDGLILRNDKKSSLGRHSKTQVHSKSLEWLTNNFDRPLKQQQSVLIEMDPNKTNDLKLIREMLFIAGQKNKQLIISVPDKKRQQLVLEQYLPTLQRQVNFTFSNFIPIVELIDLHRFKISLLEPIQSNHFQFLKARLLVWLTITKTGDLRELAINQAQFLNELRYLKEPQENENKFDFAKLQINKRKSSNCIVLDHHNLYQERQLLKQPYLLIYKPLALLNSANDDSKIKISFNRVNSLIRQLKSKVINSHTLSLNDLIDSKIINKLMLNLTQMSSEMNKFQENFSKCFLGKINYDEDKGMLDAQIDPQQMQNFLSKMKQKLNHFQSHFQLTLNLSLNKVKDKIDQLPFQQLYLFNYYFTQLTLLELEILKYHQLQQLVANNMGNFKINIFARQPHDLNTCIITASINNLNQRLKNRIYRYFKPPVIVNSFYTNGQETDSLLIDLNLIPRKTILHQVKSNRDITNLSYLSVNNFSDEVIEQILQLIIYHERNILLVFNSPKLINRFYSLMVEQQINEEFNVLAQNVNTNPNRLYKNLMNNSEVIGLVGQDWINDHSEIISKMDAVLLIISINPNNKQLLRKQLLSYLNSQQLVGIIDTSLNDNSMVSGYSNINWRPIAMDKDEFKLTWNNFLQNLKK